MYIFECSNGQYYTGRTKYLKDRIIEHQAGEGANFTRKHLKDTATSVHGAKTQAGPETRKPAEDE